MIDVHKAVIKNGDKFLIVLRSPKENIFPEHWDFPGGTLETNEKPQECVLREVAEETSLAVKVENILGSFKLDLENKGEQTHKFTIYSTEILSGEITLSHEHSDFKWATKEEILKLKIEPFMRHFF